MNCVCFCLITWNFPFFILAMNIGSGDDKFPTYPYYFHGQVRKGISMERVPLSFPTGRMQDILVHENQEFHEEKGYVDSTEHGDRMGAVRSRNDDPNMATADGDEKRFLDASPSKILEFAANHLYDQPAHRHGIYAVRSRINNCPNLGFASEQDEAKNSAEFKSKMAKVYMKCIKERYFGKSPLPYQIFAHPTESRRRLIKMESTDTFLSELPPRFNK